VNLCMVLHWSGYDIVLLEYVSTFNILAVRTVYAVESSPCGPAHVR
jgi:hypothetical protein